MSNLRVHASVKVLTGKYADLVGSVIAIDQEKKTLTVAFVGVFNGEVINTKNAYKFEQVEVV